MGCNMFMAAIRETTAQMLYNHAVHSDGKGQTWQPTTSIWYDITAPACNDDLIRYTSEKPRPRQEPTAPFCALQKQLR